ncbi:BamA/TamA family outer membrane protein [Candidatus Eisenbacteria bacterium]|uniref:BamA/TamA family outer membrane protein n=1 Tax=Eiseniibacteriota bacterium TaxID=2212470 RepID=A0ABV6YNZ4_UNCEI
MRVAQMMAKKLPGVGLTGLVVQVLVPGLLLLILQSALVLASESETPEQDALYGETIKEIRIVGAKYTKDFVIIRELKSKTGEPYIEANARRDVRRLKGLGIFADAKVYGEEEAGEVILFVEVRENLRFLPTVSMSISDENGISLGAGLKSVNLLGRAVYFSGVARFGGATTIEVTLRDPWLWGNHLGYQFEYFHRDRRNELYEFDEIADEGFFTLRSYVGERGRAGLRFSFQSIQSSEDGRTLAASNTDNVATVGLFLGYDTIDLASNPTSGWKNEIDVERSGLFNTNSDFWRTNIDLRRYFKLSKKNTIALSSLTTYTTGTVDEGIAAWQQFGLGGTNSVRGWDLGSQIGKNQLINTVEYRYMLMNTRAFSYFGITAFLGMQLTVFGDFGWAWKGEDQKEFSDTFIDGYGAGVRFLLPYVGVVRVDFGFGQPGGNIKVHLGSFEKQIKQRDRVR